MSAIKLTFQHFYLKVILSKIVFIFVTVNGELTEHRKITFNGCFFKTTKKMYELVLKNILILQLFAYFFAICQSG